jgi:Uma2 family endonuclease
MAATPQPKLSSADYLAIDRAAETRNEYVSGRVFPKAGSTANHAIINANIASELLGRLHHRNCAVTVGVLRLQVASGDAYLYPDAMVFCGPLQYAAEQKDIVTNPTLIVEVLPDSNDCWEYSGKFTQYRRLSSLKEYVLITQEEMRIEWFTLRDNGEWVYREAHGPDALCRLDSLDISIALAAVYSGIEIVK